MIKYIFIFITIVRKESASDFTRFPNGTRHFTVESNDAYSVHNISSCEEFLEGSTLNIEDVVDIDWKIFYFWNELEEKSYIIRFHLPTPTLIKRFEVELADDLTPAVNWSRSALFMETAIDFSALYLTTDVSGLFRIIPSISFEVKNVPNMKFALKFVKQGYLGIMNCNYRLCYALAPIDKMPNITHVEKAASMIGFKGSYGRSYFSVSPTPVAVPWSELPDEDDQEDDVQMEIDNDPRKLTMF